ncbi:hypothetical protein JCM11641_006466 [Rhodosporidiobolus odoratus]
MQYYPDYSSKRQANDDHYSRRGVGEVEEKDFAGPATSSAGTGSGTAGGSTTSKKARGAPTAPPLKRGSACGLCRKRKLRCDGSHPTCGTCLRLNHDCVYGDPSQERLQERQRELEERVRTLEAELEHYRSQPQVAPPSDLNLINGNSHSDTSPSSTTSTALPPPIPPPPLHSHLSFSSASAAPSSSSAFPPAPSYPPPNLPPAHLAGHTTYGSAAQNGLGYDPYTTFGVPHDRTHSNGNGNGHSDAPNAGIGAAYLAAAAAAAAATPSGYSSYPAPPFLPGSNNGAGGMNRDSEAYPLPPPLHSHPSYLSHSHAHIHTSAPTTPMSGTISLSVDTNTNGGGVQSFPFSVSSSAAHLSELINPPSVAASVSTGSQGDGGEQQTSANPNGNGNGIGINGFGFEGFGLGGGAGGGEVLSGGYFGGVGGDLALPALEVMLDLADIYFTTLHTHLPFLHRRRFLYTLHHPASLTSPPSLSLIFAVIALSSAYHDNPSIRTSGSTWYTSARTSVELAIAAGLQPSGMRIASLTVETVQALCLLALYETGQSDHQKAYLSVGSAMRIASMLGLTRMDEDRVARRTGMMGGKRLTPPALHALPRDGVLLEECRRTMCAVFVLDRFESATVGWPASISEGELRLLLPCSDALFEAGTVDSDGEDNPLWWPNDGGGKSAERGWEGIVREEESEGRVKLEEEGEGGGTRRPELPVVGIFAWLCRTVWLGGRIQAECYRPSGPPPGGPWNKHVDLDPLSSAHGDMLEMDKVLEYIRVRFGKMAKKGVVDKKVEGGVLVILVLTNCMLMNLFHLHASSGLSQLPWNPYAPSFVGSAEYAMQRCWEAERCLHEILSQLAAYENGRTTLHRSRATTFTAFVPYVLYAVAFPAKFAIGDWSVLVISRDRSENVVARVAQDLPSGDDAFPPSYFEERLAFVDAACDAMDRIGMVWPIGVKFAAMVRGDRMRLFARSLQRQQQYQQQQQQQGGSGPSPLHIHPYASPDLAGDTSGLNGF